MAEKKQPIIIRRKKIVGGHGHHGGAWKVAYADFVTAMMAFFLVMWLMGSDEETKAAISHYFNHPNTPFHDGKDPNSDMAHPLGERAGMGESIMNGMEGQNPDDLAPNPVRSESYSDKLRQLSELVSELLDDEAFGLEVKMDHLKFSVHESSLFAPGTNELSQNARDILNRIGRIFKGFEGSITIEGHSENYQSSVVKETKVLEYLRSHNLLSEDRVDTERLRNKRKQTPDSTEYAPQKPYRIDFTIEKIKI